MLGAIVSEAHIKGNSLASLGFYSVGVSLYHVLYSWFFLALADSLLFAFPLSTRFLCGTLEWHLCSSLMLCYYYLCTSTLEGVALATCHVDALNSITLLVRERKLWEFHTFKH